MFQFNKLTIKRFDGSKKNGFTFLELIITIFVMTVGIVAVFIIAQYPISYTSISIQKLTAAYLAQEGIEIVRNIRDTNWVETSGIWTGLGAGDWEADYNDQALAICSPPPPCDYDNLHFLKINGGFYNYDIVDTDTIFKRKITIDNSDPIFLKVIVLIEWRQKGKTYTVKAQENLYPWWSD